MSRRKKRGPSQTGQDSEERRRSDAKQASPPKLPDPRTPKKNLPLLIASAAVLLVWLILLIALARTS